MNDSDKKNIFTNDIVEAGDSLGDRAYDNLDSSIGTIQISQSEIDELVESSKNFQDFTSHTRTFEKIENKFIDLSITSKITLLSILSVVLSIGLCLHVLKVTLQEHPDYEMLINRYNQHLSLGLILVSFVSIGFAFLISSSLVNPLRKVRDALGRMSEGDFSKPIKIYTSDETGKLIEYANFMMSKIARKINEKEKMALEYYLDVKQKELVNRELQFLLESQSKDKDSTYEFLFAAINSIEQGLFIFDKNGMCADLYTASCLELFGVEPKGRSLFDVLNIHGEHDLNTYKTWLTTMFSDKFDLEMIIPLGPMSFTLGEIGKPGYKFIQLQYFPMRDEDTNEILNVVAIGTDTTNAVVSKLELIEQKRNAQMILSILKNRSLFHHFSIESNRILQDISSQFSQNIFDFDMIRLGVHSIKGMAASFYADVIRDTCHNFENIIPEAMENISDFKSKNKVIDGVNQIRTEVVGFITKISHMTGHNFNDSVVHRDIKLELLESFGKKLMQVDERIHEEFVNNFIKVPIISFFKNVDSNVNKLGEVLNKKILPVRLVNLDIKINSKEYVHFFQNLNHLFNNIVDHAIESPKCRAESKKPENGKIIVSGFEDDHQWGVIVEDDGRGIDPEVIKARLDELDLKDEFIGAGDDQVIYAIFHSEFTTKTVVSNISGRGVGLPALRKSVEECGGKIHLTSKIGVGSVFTFTFPKISKVKKLKQAA